MYALLSRQQEIECKGGPPARSEQRTGGKRMRMRNFYRLLVLLIGLAFSQAVR
jgi:hypothetical protein